MTETKRLYYEDVYKKEFTAKVLECREAKKGFHIILDESAFYPEGGGQPSDAGYLNDVKVKEVHEKDGELLPKVAEALQGKNALILSAREEDYKSVGAAAGLAYDQKVGAESAVDINLAKQLNVVTTQLGVKPESIVMNVGSAAVGYGYEYVVSTMDRIKAAALSQSDAMLQMPIITPVSSETWNVKESMASEEDMPEWGPVEERAISMEIMTAAADLACGSDAVILMHPQSIATISKMIKELV